MNQPYTTTASSLIAAIKFFKQYPEGSINTGIWSSPRWNKQEFMMWFMTCLNAKINRNDKRQGRCYSQQYQDDLRHDVRIIRQAKQDKIRYSGSNILRTAELKRRYPDIDHYNQFLD